MTVHAFADESRRGSLYIVAAAIATPGNLRRLRRDLRGLLLPGQRELPFNDQQDPRRHVLSGVIARLPVEVRVYQRTCQKYFEPARQECVERLTNDLLVAGAHRLVFDTRAELDTKDEETIRNVFAKQPFEARFNYEHVDSTSESMLWMAEVGRAHR